MTQEEIAAKNRVIVTNEIERRFRSAVGDRLTPAQIDNAAHAIREAQGSREAAAIAVDIAATAGIDVR